MSTTTQNSPIPAFKQAQLIAGVLALIGALGLGIALISGAYDAFFASFTFGFVFWVTMTVGACSLTYLHHSIRATWSLSILRIAEAGNKTLWWMLMCWGVMALGMYTEHLYQWSNPANVAASEILQRKAFFLNKTSYTAWSLIFFAYWMITTNLLNASSLRQDRSRDQRESERRASMGAPFGVIHLVILTFAFTLWVMSLDPAWVSTIYGVWFMIFGMRWMLALGVVILIGLRNTRPYNEVLTKQLGADIGNVLLALTMFWAYISVSQFLIIWSGNLPEEITYYANRFTGPMVFLGAFLIVGQFFGPFLMLIGMRNKRVPTNFFRIAAWIVFVCILDMVWQITPFFKVGFTWDNIGWYLLDLAAFAFVGGVWVAVFTNDLIKSAQRNALIPLHDTRLVDKFNELKEGAHA